MAARSARKHESPSAVRDTNAALRHTKNHEPHAPQGKQRFVRSSPLVERLSRPAQRAVWARERFSCSFVSGQRPGSCPGGGRGPKDRPARPPGGEGARPTPGFRGSARSAAIRNGKHPRCVVGGVGVSVRTALVYDGNLAPSVEADGYFDAVVPFRRLLGL